VVVDCATLWLSNFFGDFAQDIEKTLGAANSELDLLLARNNRYFIVSNEVGLSLHAQTEIGRRFVDLQGFFNQELARRARTVAFMVAGIPWLVKGALPSPAEGP
jgi:adenosylcobinamide kinase/adenosylcobinamide-phosphate guanylyltransferase